MKKIRSTVEDAADSAGEMLSSDSGAEGEDDESQSMCCPHDGKGGRECCFVRACKESMDATPVSCKVACRELQIMSDNLEKMMQLLRVVPKVGDDERDHRFNKAMNSEFEVQQRELNTIIMEAREAAMVIVRSKQPKQEGDEERTRADSVGLMAKRRRWTELVPLMDKELDKLNQIQIELQDTARQQWKDGVNDLDMSPQKLAMQQKTVKLIEDQIESVKQMVEGSLKQRVKTLEEKANKALLALQKLGPEDSGGMPDLDPESWERYEKYIAKDLEIDAMFNSLYEQNVQLFEIGAQVLDQSKQNNAAYELLGQDVENITQVAEKALTMSKKVKRWLKARGKGLVCVYVLMILLLLAACYATYCANGGSECKKLSR